MVIGTETGKRAKRIVPRRTGRPPKTETQRIRDKILDVAAVSFFSEGYGATSIEAIARRARISKRTLYHRFEDKAALFSAVVHRVIQNLRPPQVDPLFEGKSLEEILHVIARVILRASLSPEALALQRIILAEATRFPELALIVSEQGSRKEALQRIGALLMRGGKTPTKDAPFLAEQFLQMVVSAPQRRAMGLGQPMNAEELDAWAKNTVALFLRGYRG